MGGNFSNIRVADIILRSYQFKMTYFIKPISEIRGLLAEPGPTRETSDRAIRLWGVAFNFVTHKRRKALLSPGDFQRP